jgi:death-on-curing protein
MLVPSPSDILRIHDRIIEVTGGSPGLREPGLLSAIAEKPLATFDNHDLYPTLADKAAALFEALCNYSPRKTKPVKSRI